jgi:DNA mismatch repair protein MutS2
LQIEPPKARPTRELADANTLNSGDRVAILGQEGHGEVVSVKGKTAEVLFGGMKTLVKVNLLEKLSRAEVREREATARKTAAANSGPSLDLTGRMAGFSPTLDLRGERAEDALTKLMSFVDDAVMFGIPEIKILHGRGNGVLRQIARDYLRRNRTIASVGDEHADRGGDGVTLAVLK